MGNMSIVALAVSSGCHSASGAFKPTLLGNVALQCCFKRLGEMRKERNGRNKKKKKRLLLPNLCLTGAGTVGCVISWCGRGVQSQGFWVMGFFGAIGDLEELFTHNFIIGLLSRGSMPVLLPYTFNLTLWKPEVGPRVKAGCRGCRAGISDEDEPDSPWCLFFFCRVEELRRRKSSCNKV